MIVFVGPGDGEALSEGEGDADGDMPCNMPRSETDGDMPCFMMPGDTETDGDMSGDGGQECDERPPVDVVGDVQPSMCMSVTERFRVAVVDPDTSSMLPGIWNAKQSFARILECNCPAAEV